MSALRLVPLGGVGEFGANSLLLEGPGGGGLVVDAGAAFNGLDAYGIAYEVPDYSMLDSEPAAVFLTHAHDDHARGLEGLVGAFPGVPVYGTEATLARALRQVEGEVAGGSVRAGAAVRVAGFEVDTLPVSHSLPGTVAVRARADAATAVILTDFRMAPSALGEATSREAMAAWGRDGVDVLLLDATNALVEAGPPEETVVAEALAGQVRATPGAVVAVTFASHLGRFTQLARAALAAGRVVVPVGHGLVEALAIQASLGGTGLPPGLVVQARELPRLPRDRVVIVATGSQGEPASVFPQIAAGTLPGFRLQRGDRVLHAARVIPGNERRLAHLFDECVRRGATVVSAETEPLHASGHAHRAELAAAVELLRPGFVVPIHGRRRNLQAVADLAERVGARTAVVENGQEMTVAAGEVAATGGLRGVGRRLVEDSGALVDDPAVVHNRRTLARDGLVVAVLPVSAGPRGELGEPRIFAHGLVLPPGADVDLAAALGAALRRELRGRPPDPERLRSTMTRWLRNELRRLIRRRPVVASLVLEL